MVLYYWLFHSRFNNQKKYGGVICAIPLQTQFIYFTDTCFIQHHINKHTASIMFDSNIATTGIANDVFASTLWPCTIYSHKYDLKKLFNSSYLANFKFSNGSFDYSSSVATAVRKLFTDNAILITVIFKRNTAAYGGAICAISLQTQFISLTLASFNTISINTQHQLYLNQTQLMGTVLPNLHKYLVLACIWYLYS